MAPGQQVRAFAFVLVVRPVPGRALLLGGQLSFELLDPRFECGNHIDHRQAAWGLYGQRFWWCFPSPIVSGGTYAQKVTFLPNPSPGTKTPRVHDAAE